MLFRRFRHRRLRPLLAGLAALVLVGAVAWIQLAPIPAPTREVVKTLSDVPFHR